MDLKEQACRSSGKSRSMTTATESLQNTGRTSLAIATCASAALTIYRESMCLRAASRVNHMPIAESEGEAPTTATSGLSISDSFASLGQDGSWRKTYRGYFQLMMDGFSEPFCGTWPRAGTAQNGTAYQQQPLVPRISGTAFSYWPTPTVPNGGRSPKGGMSPTGQTPDGQKRQVDLQHAVRMVERRMWPTPTQADGMGGPGNSGWQGGLNLRTAVKRWPTPTARDWRSGKASEATHDRNSRPLNEVAAQGQASGQLNPQFVEWLMGFPIGWTDLEDSETP